MARWALPWLVVYWRAGEDDVYRDPPLSTQLWMRLNQPALPLAKVQIAVVGAPYDGSVTHARGAALAPAELRALSADSWFFTEEGIDLRGLRIRDLGDVPVDNDDALATQQALAAAVCPVVKARAIPLVLGGDHSITSGVVAGVAGHEPLGVLWLDAHADLMDSYRGSGGREESRWNHACPLRRICELEAVGPERILLVGLRDLMAPEREYIHDRGVAVIYGHELSRLTPAEVAGQVYRHLGDLPGGVYISFDIDFLDPAAAPGTGTPVPGGASSRYLFDLIHALARPPAGRAPLHIAGFDVVEIAPPLDHNHITGWAGMRVIAEMCGYVQQFTFPLGRRRPAWRSAGRAGRP